MNAHEYFISFSMHQVVETEKRIIIDSFFGVVGAKLNSHLHCLASLKE